MMILKMAEIEERPFKIRKLNTNSDGVCDVGKSSFSRETPDENDEHSGGTSHSDPEEGNGLLEAHQDGSIATEAASLPMSKSQLKKIRKKQAWEDGKDYRKAKRRERNKLKKARRAEAKIATAESHPEVEPAAVLQSKHFRASQLPVTFVIDCDFDELMLEKEIISLGTQITRSYSDNKGAPYRAHFVVSSFGGRLKERFETVLANNHLGWKGARITEKDFIAAAEEAHAIMHSKDGGKLLGAFATKPDNSLESTEAIATDDPASTECPGVLPEPAPELSVAMATESHSNKESSLQRSYNATGSRSESITSEEKSGNTKPSIVYLTSDSEHTLEKLEPFTTYIIGGIVDKNRHKGICYKRAREYNVRTARLPIGDYMKMQSRVVLATNHVVEIMVRWLEDGDWGKAFLRVIPKRKEAKLKKSLKSEVSDEDDEVEEEENQHKDGGEKVGDIEIDGLVEGN